MNSQAKDEDADEDVNRLHDIVVEEVSLVDHAANNHRFLIVKRSDDMADHETKDDPVTDLNEEDDEDDEDEMTTGEDPNENGEEQEASGDATQNAATLSLAVAALEGLTETVELLGAANQEGAASRLAELATDLRGVSEQLGTLAGTPGSTGEGAKGKEPGRTATKDDALAGTISTVRATLQQVGTLLCGQGAAPADKPAQPTSQPSASGELGEQLKTLTSELRSLTTTVKEQQQRLARLEKRVGMPNSKAAGEQPRRRGKDSHDDDGWPLDMNRSFDRDSVDKSTSFHDV
jgi:hypothetical protein